MRQLALLVEQVTFRDQYEQVLAVECAKRLLHMRQCLDRVAQEVTADIEDFGDRLRGHTTICDLDRRLDHREREALDAEAVMLEVPLLRLKQPLRDMSSLGIIAKQSGKMLLCQAVELLVLPERVVGIEADGRDGAHDQSSSIPYGPERRAGQGFCPAPHVTVRVLPATCASRRSLPPAP